MDNKILDMSNEQMQKLYTALSVICTEVGLDNTNTKFHTKLEEALAALREAYSIANPNRQD